MQKVRQLSRGGGSNDTETEECNFTGNSSSDGRPAEMFEYLSEVNMWRCTDYKTDCTVLDSLKSVDQGLNETSQERAAPREAIRILVASSVR